MTLEASQNNSPDHGHPSEAPHDGRSRSIEWYRAVLSSTLDPIVTIDWSGRIHAVSDTIERVLGWRSSELIGQNIRVLMPEPHTGRHDEYLTTYRRTGKTGILGQPRELDAAHRDGHMVRVEISVSRVDVPGEPEPLFTGIIHDLTDRRLAEQALRESERRFRSMLDNTQLMAVMLDREGRIEYCNEYLLTVTGWQRHEILSQDWFELFIPEDERDDVVRTFRDGIEQADIASHFEHDILTRDGDRRRIAWSNALVRDLNHRIAGATGLGTDVTSQRRMAEELERHRRHLQEIVAERTDELAASQEKLRVTDRLASIGTLAAGLGHDMNNVLLPVRCHLDAVIGHELPDDVTPHVEAVRTSVTYLQQLADALHLLALDPDDTDASTGATNLTSWWAQVGTLLARALPSKVRLKTRLESDLPTVAIEAHRLTQAMLNLIVNAGEAVGDRGQVRVWAAPHAARGVVRLGVTDDGPGMTDEVKRHALDAFFTTKSRGLGTGLGLSLVQGVVHAVGGAVSIDSKRGEGTTIVLDLPTTSSRASQPGDARAGTAAVCLNDRRISGLFSTLLTAAGLEVTTVATDDLEPCDLWVVCDTPETRAVADRLPPDARPCVVLVGNGADAWSALSPFTIEDSSDFESTREVLNRAIEALS